MCLIFDMDIDNALITRFVTIGFAAMTVAITTLWRQHINNYKECRLERAALKKKLEDLEAKLNKAQVDILKPCGSENCGRAVVKVEHNDVEDIVKKLFGRDLSQ